MLLPAGSHHRMGKAIRLPLEGKLSAELTDEVLQV